MEEDMAMEGLVAAGAVDDQPDGAEERRVLGIVPEAMMSKRVSVLVFRPSVPFAGSVRNTGFSAVIVRKAAQSAHSGAVEQE